MMSAVVATSLQGPASPVSRPPPRPYSTPPGAPRIERSWGLLSRGLNAPVTLADAETICVPAAGVWGQRGHDARYLTT